VYSSGAGDAELGVGWSLSGLSKITPCARIQAIDARAFPAQLDGSDPICLDGTRLIDTSNGLGTSFQAEDDPYTQITTFTDAASGTRAFRVQSQTGTIRIFKQYGQNPGNVAGIYWLLDSEQDLDGNGISYTYDNLSAPIQAGLKAAVGVWEYRIKTITYTNRVSAAGTTPGLRMVVFNYEARPDPRSMRYGPSNVDPRCAADPKYCLAPRPIDVRISQRIHSIDVYGPTPFTGTSVLGVNALWSYGFGYVTSPATGRSLLQTVIKTAAQGGQSRARTFAYDSASGMGSDTARFVKTSTVAVPPALYGDLRHNGRTEGLGFSAILTGTGNVTPPVILDYASSGLTSTATSGLETADLTHGHVVDVNGDGFPDIIAPSTVVPAGASNPNNPANPGLLYHLYTYQPSNGSYQDTPTSFWFINPNEPQYNGNTGITGIQSPPNPLYFVDMTGTGMSGAVYANHWIGGGGSTDLHCNPFVARPVQGWWGGCTQYNWSVVPPGNFTSPTPAMTQFFGVGTPAVTGIGPVAPESGKPGSSFTGTYTGQFNSMTLSDGSGVGVLFAGVNLPDVYAQYGSPTPPQGSNVPWLAWTDRNLPLWDVSGSQNGATTPDTFGSNYNVRLDTADPTGTHMWLWLWADLSTRMGNFDGQSATEIFAPNLPSKPAGYWSVRTMDYDQDGRTDVVALHFTPPSNPGTNPTVLDDAFLYHWTVNGTLQVTENPKLIPLMVADFDGDGITDMIGGTAEELTSSACEPAGTGAQQAGYLYMGVSVAHDWLGTVYDQGSPTSELVTYSFQQQPAPPDGQCGAYPVECQLRGKRVVSSYSVFQGYENGGWITHDYTYGMPRYDISGRGFLGFDWIDDWVPTRPDETVTYYDNTTSHYRGAYLGVRPVWTVHNVPTVALPANAAGAPVHTTLSWNNYQVALPTAVGYTVQRQSWSTQENEGFASLTLSPTSCSLATPTFQAFGASCHFGAVSNPSVVRSRGGYTNYDAYGNSTYDFNRTFGGVVKTKQTTYYAPDATHYLRSLPLAVETQEYSDGNTAPTTRLVNYWYDPAHPAQVQTQAEDLYPTGSTPVDPDAATVTTWVRSADGVPTQVTTYAWGTNAAGAYLEPARTTTYTLDPDEGMFPRTVTNALGQVTQELVNPAFGVVQDSLDPNLVAHQTVLDDFGRVHSQWDAAGTTITTSYAQRLAGTYVVGWNVTTTSPGLASSVRGYDMLGRLVSEQHTDFSTASASSPVWDVTTTTYDVLGRVAATSRPGVGSASTYGTTYAYDPLDRLTQTIAPDGGVVTQTHLFRSTQITQTTNASPPVTRTRTVLSDLDGRKVSVTEAGPSGQTVTMAWAYGDFGNLVSVTDNTGHVTANTYDLHGRKTQSIDPDAGTTTWAYNGFGEVETQSRAAAGGALVTTYARDALGRTTSIGYSDGTSASFTYDTATNGVGKIATSVSQDGVVETFGYDGFSHPNYTGWTVPTGAGGTEYFDASLVYDPKGRPYQQSYPLAGSSTRVTVQNNYDPVTGYVKSVMEVDGTPRTLWTVTERNADGTLSGGVYGNGVTEYRGYTPDVGRPLYTVALNSAGTYIEYLAYGYTNDGDLSSRMDYMRGRSESYAYDELDRLSSWTVSSGSTTNTTQYGYDPYGFGNITSVTVNGGLVETDSYGYLSHVIHGANFKPHALTSRTRYSIFGSSTATFGYDEPGRQTSASAIRSSVTYTDFDLPRTIASIDGSTTTMLYDAAGARIKKTDGFTGVTSVTLGGLFERRTPSSGTPEYVLTVPGTDGIQIQMDLISGVTTDTYLHPDRLGSVVMTTNDAGAVGSYLDYEPFGQRVDVYGRKENLSPDVQRGFAGQQMDDDLGLINMTGRIYDPSLRHFLSVDPHVTFPFNTQSYNPFSYVMNNPVNRTDPTGLDDGGGDSGGGGDGGDGDSGSPTAGTDNSTSPAGPPTISGDSDASPAGGFAPVWLLEALPASVVVGAAGGEEPDDPYGTITSIEQIAEFERGRDVTHLWWSIVSPLHIVGDRWLGAPVGIVTVGEFIVPEIDGPSTPGTASCDGGWGICTPAQIDQPPNDWNHPEPEEAPSAKYEVTDPRVYHFGVGASASVLLVGISIEAGGATRQSESVGRINSWYLNISWVMSVGAAAGIGPTVGRTDSYSSFVGDSFGQAGVIGPVSITRESSDGTHNQTVGWDVGLAAKGVGVAPYVQTEGHTYGYGDTGIK
jgi:RHS repeat-associated protein